MIEFEIMQKVWSEQKGEAMYVINEEALHDVVVRKKDAASRSKLEYDQLLTLSLTVNVPHLAAT